MPELIYPNHCNNLSTFQYVDGYEMTKKSIIPLNKEVNQLYKMHVDEKNHLCDVTNNKNLTNLSCIEKVPFFLSKHSNKEVLHSLYVLLKSVI